MLAEKVINYLNKLYYLTNFLKWLKHHFVIFNFTKSEILFYEIWNSTVKHQID